MAVRSWHGVGRRPILPSALMPRLGMDGAASAPLRSSWPLLTGQVRQHVATDVFGRVPPPPPPEVGPGILPAAKLQPAGTPKLVQVVAPGRETGLGAGRNGASESSNLSNFVLDPPASNSVAGISNTVCPLCRTPVPLKGLLQHINNFHPDADREYARKVVRERYTLLKAAQKREGSGATTGSSERLGSGLPPAPGGSAVPSTSGFACRHCSPSAPLFASVDAVMKHICDAHPEQDVDEEPLPAKVNRSPAAGHPSLSKLVVAPLVAAAKQQTPLEFTETQFPCEICHKVFGSELDLIQHIDAAHAEEIADPLPSTEAEVETAATPSATPASPPQKPPSPPPSAKVSTYIPTTNEPISVRCDLCGSKSKIFTSEVALHAHIVSKHSNEVVDAPTKVKELLATGHTDQTFVCVHCAKVFPTSQALNGHIYNKHGGKTGTAGVGAEQPSWSLSDPGSVFAGVAGEGGPAGSTTTVPGGVWWCNDCNRGFKSGSALTGHLTSKHQLPTQSLPCPACRRVFPDVFALKSHVAQAHKNLDDSLFDENVSYDCPHCPRKFLSSTALDVHVSTYHKGRVK